MVCLAPEHEERKSEKDADHVEWVDAGEAGAPEACSRRRQARGVAVDVGVREHEAGEDEEEIDPHVPAPEKRAERAAREQERRATESEESVEEEDMERRQEAKTRERAELGTTIGVGALWAVEERAGHGRAFV